METHLKDDQNNPVSASKEQPVKEKCVCSGLGDVFDCTKDCDKNFPSSTVLEGDFEKEAEELIRKHLNGGMITRGLRKCVINAIIESRQMSYQELQLWKDRVKESHRCYDILEKEMSSKAVHTEVICPECEGNGWNIGIDSELVCCGNISDEGNCCNVPSLSQKQVQQMCANCHGQGHIPCPRTDDDIEKIVSKRVQETLRLFADFMLAQGIWADEDSGWIKCAFTKDAKPISNQELISEFLISWPKFSFTGTDDKLKELITEIDKVIYMWQDPSNEMEGLHTFNTLKSKATELLNQK